MSYNNIKNAALRLFSTKGFEGTTVREIASESGLKPSSIYSHITNKEDLFIMIWNECIQNTFKSVADIALQIENNALYDPEKILYTYYIRVINHFTKNRNDYLFLKQAIFFTKSKDILNKVQIKDFLNDDAIFEYFSKFFIQLQKDGLILGIDHKALCLSYLGIMIACLEEDLIYNIKLNNSHINTLWNIFWKGISQ